MTTDHKEVRVWVDGCFDMLHFGHANALRQAKQLGDKLYVGVHSDDEIQLNKGPPLFNENERYKMLCSIKWVDHVIFNAPYVTQLDVMDTYNCDFCAHGDDITVGFDGRDTYYKVKDAKRFKEFKRTPGVSTTNIVQRIMEIDSDMDQRKEELSKYTSGSSFYPNTLLISYFQSEYKDPLPSDTIVYIPGSFDLFHVGHVMLLEKCRELGNYLVVGLYSDDDVTKIKGKNYPLMSFYERLLSLLSCKFVSNVILNAPLEITEELLESLKVDKVVHGNVDFGKMEPYFQVAKSKRILHLIDSGSSLTFEDIIQRVKQNQNGYEERNRLKQMKEVNYLQKNHN